MSLKEDRVWGVMRLEGVVPSGICWIDKDGCNVISVIGGI